MSTPNFPRPVIGTYYTIGLDTYDRDEIKKDIEKEEEREGSELEDYIQMLIENDWHDSVLNVTADIEEEFWTDISFCFNVRTKRWWEQEFNRVELDVKSWHYEWAILDIKITWYDWDDRPKYAEKKLQYIIKKIEKIFKRYSTEMRLDWVFSNWEAIYSLVK